MLHFLPKFKTAFVWATLLLCLVLLVCPTQVQAAEGFEVSVKSPTNPDQIFTGEEVYDLTVYLQGNPGEAYNVNYKVIDSRKLVLVQSREPISVTTSDSGAAEVLLDLSSLKGRDTFRVEITVTNASGDIVGTTSSTFSRVAKNSVFSAVANVRNGVLFSIDPEIPDLYLYLAKTDHFPETLMVTYRITDMEGRILRQTKGNASLSNKDYMIIPLNFHGLETTGQCRVSYSVYDDTGNLRSSGSSYFQHYGSYYVQTSLRSEQDKTGLIFANNEPYDLVLDVRKIDNFAESFTMRYTVTDASGAVVFQSTGDLSLPENGVVSVPLDLSGVTGYGIFDLTVTAIDANGNENDTCFSFSRVLSTAKPGDLPMVNINDHFTSYNGDANKKLELSAQAGFAMWRCSIPWVSVERSHGVYSMPAAVDEVMATTESLGMEPLIILAYGNDELYGLPDPTKPGWLEAYANYCKYIAQYFGDRVNYYEIWNEWNHSTMGKTDSKRHGGNYYAMALVAASEAIRSVNPNAKIIGGAMAGHGEAWMTAMLGYDGNNDGKSDAMEAMDGFSYHAYNTDFATCFYSPWDKGFFNSADEVITVLNRYGDASTKEIWITESGWSTAIGPGVTEEVQAAYFVQVHAWMLANSDKVDRYFWYDFMNDRDFNELDWDPNAGEHNWGLIHSWTNTGNEPLPYSAKKSYVAACAMTSILANAQYMDTFALGDGIYAYRFQKDGQDLLVAFMDGNTKTVNVTFGGNLTVTDMYGNATTHSSGSAALTISGTPIYIACAPGAITSIG